MIAADDDRHVAFANDALDALRQTHADLAHGFQAVGAIGRGGPDDVGPARAESRARAAAR